jgi:DNA helicase II / ATP-dependent DNA helicase PcrA
MTDHFPASTIVNGVMLNQVQQEAVMHDRGPQLVFAGAGTGKTRVLTAKIAHLIQRKNIAPGNIFAATFTNKAAREMQRRVETIVGIGCMGLWIGTFHSLCARILRREAQSIGYTSSFSIFDTDDQLSIIKKSMKDLKIDERTMPPRMALHSISNYKSACIPYQDLEGKQTNYFEQELIRIYCAYQKSLVRQQAMDFDDLIANCVYLFRSSEETLIKYQRLFKHVLVDEYQDTNRAQFNLVKLLAQAHGNIFVVGDDDQSIYGWRGAEIENILSFEKVFPGTATFKLEQNYRSTKTILDFANAAIAPNNRRAPKRLWSPREGGEKVTVLRFRDDRHEADSIGSAIKDLIGSGVKGGDIAVLFRTNAQSRLFEESLRKKRVPYVLVGGTSFYERREVKDCLAYLRLLVNPLDDVSFLRIMNVPPRGLGDKARETLSGRAAQTNRSLLQLLLDDKESGAGVRAEKGLSELRTIFSLLVDVNNRQESPYEILKQTLSLTGYLDLLDGEDSEDARSRVENVNELTNALAVWSEENIGKGLSAFLEEIALASDVDKWKKSDETVNLMTLHCAKGLEFKFVFLVGCEDGILPSRQNFDEENKIEEERRLFYVGITRAIESFKMAWADQRMRFGSIIPGMPSRFLRPIPVELYSFSDLSSSLDETRESTAYQAAPRSSMNKQPQGPSRLAHDDFSQETVEYRVGQRVKHKLYGQGKILSLSGFGVDLHLTVLFSDGSHRKLMAKFANFEHGQ